MQCIEFMGMPNAGKSTHIKYLEKILKEYNFNVKIIQGGARLSPLDKDEAFLFNTWSFHSVSNRIMELKKENPDFLLVDRGVYDHMVFAKTLYEKGRIHKSQSEAQLKYFREFLFLEDRVLLFMAKPQDSLQRENHVGRVMNENFLNLLYKFYNEMTNKIQKKHCIIDGTKDMEENRKKIIEFILRDKK